jgi:hypothetical protein
MLRPAHRARRHKTLDSIWVDAVASDSKWVRSARKGFEAPLRGFVAERARAVMGADSAITLDGQSRVAMGITTYALPRSASLAAKQKPRRTNVGADDELSGGGAVRQGSPSAIGLERRERVQAKLIVQRLDPLRHMHMDSSSTRAARGVSAGGRGGLRGAGELQDALQCERLADAEPPDDDIGGLRSRQTDQRPGFRMRLAWHSMRTTLRGNSPSEREPMRIWAARLRGSGFFPLF